MSVDGFLNETTSWQLPDIEMPKLGKELEKYKEVNGKYPQHLSTVRSSEEICVRWKVIIINYTYDRCSKVSYTPSADLRTFKMSAKAFDGTTIYYPKPLK